MIATPPLVPRETPLTLAQKVVRAVVVLAVAAVVGGLVLTLSFLITPVALAFVGFYVLGPVVNFLESRRLPRWTAVLLCFAVGISIAVGIGLVVWPSLEAWLQQKPSQGEKSVFEIQLANRLVEWEHALRRTYPKIEWHALFDRLRALLEGQRKRLMETLPLLALGLLSNAGTFLLAPIITLFLLLDGAAMHRRVISWVPNRYFEMVLVLLHRVDRQISAYLRGAASESALVAILLSGALAAVGMPNAALFGCIYGVANVIPLLGPLLGAGAGLLYAMMDPTAPALGVLAACYGGTYVVDAMLINPMVVGKNLNLHPLTIIVGISIGGALGGVVGMLVSIPTIAVCKAVIWTLFEGLRSRQLV